jgi:hypothetical protein
MRDNEETQPHEALAQFQKNERRHEGITKGLDEAAFSFLLFTQESRVSEVLMVSSILTEKRSI